MRPQALSFALRRLAAAVSVALAPGAFAADVQTLGTVEVLGTTTSLTGTADSANEGTVTRRQIEARPVLRPGELLEFTPGLVITQHSGEGKANQYFLRGFNLDHGTDLAISVDGMPVNQRTHGHGQGYADLNFLITDLVQGMQYRKGPYYADEGDFSAAGATHVQLADRLERGIGDLGAGSHGYRRLLVADSPRVGSGNLLYGLELLRNDGPWTNPDDFRKLNAMLRYSSGNAQNGFHVTAMAYQGRWNSTDQVPRRAVDGGLIGRFDALDATDGGEASRYSLSAAWKRTAGNGVTAANVYAIRSRLNLWSNFTFFQDDPVNGDQFEQSDARITTGFDLRHTWLGQWGGREVEQSVGLQARNDNIGVGLYGTAARQRLATTREDKVVETSAGLWYQNSLRWAERFRTVAGLRLDAFRGEVTSDNAANSGSTRDHLASPKLSLVFGPWAKTEYYVNLGRGFHSNDLRGTTITVDPKSGAPADRVPLLVRTTGYEAGFRTAVVPQLQSSFTVFQLDFDSELLFVGDAGTTAASRPSRRTGFEWTNLYTPLPWLILDADIAFSKARFTDVDPAGNRIPGAIEGVATFTASVENLGPWYGAMRVRYFGPRPLIEDNSVRSSSTTLVSGRIGYRFDKRFRVQLDAFNLLDRRASQIDYYYPSQLRGEAAPVNDVHFHPAEPRSLRISAIVSF